MEFSLYSARVSKHNACFLLQSLEMTQQLRSIRVDLEEFEIAWDLNCPRIGYDGQSRDVLAIISLAMELLGRKEVADPGHPRIRYDSQDAMLRFLNQV